MRYSKIVYHYFNPPPLKLYHYFFLFQSSSTTITDDASDMLLHPIICDSLSNVSELVCDMFNLTLRLAADDDTKH